MIPKVMVLQGEELEKWREHRIVAMSFKETEELIGELQNALVDQRGLSGRTGLTFFIVLRP